MSKWGKLLLASWTRSDSWPGVASRRWMFWKSLLQLACFKRIEEQVRGVHKRLLENMFIPEPIQRWEDEYIFSEATWTDAFDDADFSLCQNKLIHQWCKNTHKLYKDWQFAVSGFSKCVFAEAHATCPSFPTWISCPNRNSMLAPQYTWPF